MRGMVEGIGKEGWVNAGGLSGVTECSVTSRMGRDVGGKWMLRAFKRGCRRLVRVEWWD